jgi:hypothetical protein
MDPEPGGPKISGSRSTTLARTLMFFLYIFPYLCNGVFFSCLRYPGQDPEGVQRQRRHDGPSANRLHRQLHVFRATFRLPRHGGHWLADFPSTGTSISCRIVLPRPLLLIPYIVADPHHLDADPDPALHFDADPDPAFHSDADPDPTTHVFPDLDPLMLQYDPLRLLPFHSDADPDPAFHFYANPDPAFHFDADPDPAYHKMIRFRIRNTGPF